MECVVVKSGADFVCVLCGRRYSRRVRAACKGREAASKLVPSDDFEEILKELNVEVSPDCSLLELWHCWRQAIARWKEAGKPVRTKAEMEERLSVCSGDSSRQECEHYAQRLGMVGYCTVCGCHVSTSNIGELNKIRMATEVCPLGKWT